uniref:Uncharacterized protein n=1 Tax=Arundo donax TaxID=35708 RepID=A0A0A8ZQJ7_ARUDO
MLSPSPPPSALAPSQLLRLGATNCCCMLSRVPIRANIRSRPSKTRSQRSSSFFSTAVIASNTNWVCAEDALLCFSCPICVTLFEPQHILIASSGCSWV